MSCCCFLHAPHPAGAGLVSASVAPEKKKHGMYATGWETCAYVKFQLIAWKVSQSLRVLGKVKSLQGEISKSIKRAFVSSFKNSYGKLSSLSSNANNNLQVLNLSALSSLIPSLFSDIVLSAAWLSFPDLLYYLSKDAKAAVTIAQREKWSSSRLGRRLSGAANQKQRRDASSAQKCFGGPIRSMGNGSEVSYFSDLPRCWANVLHYKRRDDGKCNPDMEIGLVKRISEEIKLYGPFTGLPTRTIHVLCWSNTLSC